MSVSIGAPSVSRHARRIWRRAVLYAVLIAIAATTMMPFFWMVSSSLKDRAKIFAYPPQWIPNPFVFRNYVDAWNAIPFGRFILNTLKIALLSVVGQMIFASMAGYGFARFQFPLKNLFFSMLLAVMMVPSVVNTVPRFLIFRYLNWINTHAPLIVPAVFSSTFGTFLFRQFMMSIPQDLEDAARIDGAGPFGAYWRIFLPLCKPAAAVLATFTFIGTWNAFFGPFIYLTDVEKMTVNVGLAFFRSEEGTSWNLLMAGSCITLMPTFVVFLFTQRYFQRGALLSGLGGT
jgi:multiple sugar transport system permease protein